MIPAGGLSPDHQRWIHPRYDFFLPVKVLSKVFRGKFTDGLKSAFAAGELHFPGRMKMLAERRRSTPSFGRCFVSAGSSMPSGRSEDPSMSFTTWPVTRTASLFLITAS